MNSRINTKRIALAILLVGLAAIIVWLWIQDKHDVGVEAATPAAMQHVAIVNGVTVVTLDTATQMQSGIHTEPLSAASYQAEKDAYGTVLDLQPLIDCACATIRRRPMPRRHGQR